MTRVRPHILLLGGTADSRELATLILRQFRNVIRLTTSLAGRTLSPRTIQGDVRIGGFGGSDGLEAYIKSESVSVLIDATHPFAEKISWSANKVASRLCLPYLSLRRPKWMLPTEFNIRYVSDTISAADELKQIPAKRVMLTTGLQSLNSFTMLSDIWFLVRLIEPSTINAALLNAKFIFGRPPFSVGQEKKLLQQNNIDTLISKDSGGMLTQAKFFAANSLDVNIILIDRPAVPPSEHVECPTDAVDWLQSVLGRKTW